MRRRGGVGAFYYKKPNLSREKDYRICVESIQKSEAYGIGFVSRDEKKAYMTNHILRMSLEIFKEVKFSKVNGHLNFIIGSILGMSVVAT